MIIYRLTDRIPVKMGEVTFWVAPLSFQAKLEMDACVKMRAGEEVVDHARRVLVCLKHSIKEVEGLKDAAGDDYHLAFDPSGVLTDECAAELMQADTSAALQVSCLKLAASIDEHKVKGVEINLGGVRTAKKKDALA